MHRKVFFSFVSIILLSACGTTPSDRAISGGAIGAGAGTVAAIIVDGNPVTGLLVGGAAGAITGAVTQPKNLDLGQPIWETWQH